MLFIVCTLQTITLYSQIANYVNNGGFEKIYSCGISIESVKYWRAIDSSGGGILNCNYCIPNIPNNGFTYQTPHSGNGYCQFTFLCQPPQCSINSNRGYIRNRLKSTLQFGKVYCVKTWVNISNPSSYGISNIGLFFVDNSIDTITKVAIPLTYISPQFENPTTNILIDTMNWVAITGTFVANGTEKNCVIGNFRSDAATTKTLINTAILPTIGCDMLIDDVSCIPIDLPANAGADAYVVPGNTVYIGRPQDVGIDEACTWYNLTNTTTPIANAAGITVTVTTTQSYMVKQNICGIIKYDTVVVYASGVGLNELRIKDYELKVYPNPATEMLNVELLVFNSEAYKIELINALGQLIREEEITFKNNIANINTKELQAGVYILSLRVADEGSVSSGRRIIKKRFVIAR